MAKYPYDTFGSLDSIIKDYSDLKDSKIYKNINNDNYKQYDFKKLKDDVYNKSPPPIYISQYIQSMPNISLPNTPSNSSGINWGTRQTTETAYVQPTEEEVQRVLAAIHMVSKLPEDQQRQLIEATKEIRFFFDGQIRAKFGGARHFNAIRCLNDPTRTNVESRLSMRNVQLAGEEFFGLNRFMPSYADVADVQWWAVYKDGGWDLDRWNPEGEHLDTRMGGWGDLVGSVLKVNGRVLSPEETIAFYRTIKLRNEMKYMNEQSRQALETMLRDLDGVRRLLPRRSEEALELAHDLGLVDANGRSLTYVGKSMITRTKATERKQRQLTERDPEVRKIVVPTIFA